MKKDYSHLVIVLDESGSMGRIREETVAGFNKLLTEQAKVPGTASCQVFKFNSEVTVGPLVPLGELPRLTRSTFTPKGNSALYDAIATAIDKTGEVLSALAEEDRPDKVVVAVLTDGLDRGSKVANLETVRAKVENQVNSYSWFIALLGANMDVKHEAAKLGISADAAIRFTADSGGVKAGFHRLSNATFNYRKGLGRSLAGADRPTRINLAAIAG